MGPAHLALGVGLASVIVCEHKLIPTILLVVACYAYHYFSKPSPAFTHTKSNPDGPDMDVYSELFRNGLEINPHHKMNVMGGIWFDGQCPFKENLDAFDERIRLFDRFATRMDLEKPGGHCEFKAMRKDWHARENFRFHNSRAPDVSTPACEELCAKYANRPWDLTKPLFRCDCHMDEQKGFAFWDMAHAIADGATGMQLVFGIADPDPDQVTPFEKLGQKKNRPSLVMKLAKKAWSGLLMGFRWVYYSPYMVSLMRSGAMPHDPTCFDSLRGEKRCKEAAYLLMDTFGLLKLKLDAKAINPNATVNDAILAGCAGTVHDYMKLHEKRCPFIQGDDTKLTVLFTADRRAILGQRPDFGLGQKAGERVKCGNEPVAVPFRLSIGSSSHEKRLNCIVEDTLKMKRAPMFMLLLLRHRLVKLAELHGTDGVARLLFSSESYSKTSYRPLYITNVPALTKKARMWSVTLDKYLGFVSAVNMITAISYAGTITPTFCFDPQQFSDKDLLRALFNRNLARH